MPLFGDPFGGTMGAFKPPKIDLSFAGLFGGSPGPGVAEALPPMGGSMKFTPTDYQNVMPFEPAPKPQPDPAEDWQVQPRQEAPRPAMQPLYTRDEAGGMEPPAQRPGPFTTRDEARQIQARMAGVSVDQLPPSVEQAKYGQEYDANKGRFSQENIILRAKQGDKAASDMLWAASGRDEGAYMRAMDTGKLPYQIEDERNAAAAAAQQEERQFRFGMAERGMSLEEQKAAWGNEQAKVAQAFQSEKMKLESAYKDGLLSIEQLKAETAKLTAEAQTELQRRQIAITERGQGLAENKFALEAEKARNPAAFQDPLAKRQAEAQTGLVEAQSGLAQAELARQGRGERPPLQQRAAEKAAMNRAQQLLDADPTMAPEEAQRRAAQELDVAAESVPVPQYGSSVGSYQNAFKAAGFQSDKHALSVVINNMIQGNPAAAGDPGTFMQRMGPEILKNLIDAGVPPPAAAKAVAQEARKPR